MTLHNGGTFPAHLHKTEELVVSQVMVGEHAKRNSPFQVMHHCTSEFSVEISYLGEGCDN